MNICICDDDSIFCEQLKEKLLALDAQADITVFVNSEELLQSLSSPLVKYDVFFLDIRLKDDLADGIELAKTLAKLQPAAQIVFVTAYPEYVSDVYEAEHCYFIKKSDLDVYLPKSLEKASRALSERPLLLSTENGLVKVLPSEIRYIERKGKNAQIATSAGELITVYKSLEAVERLLSDKDFTRCHYSFVIPLRLIRSLTRTDVELDGGVKIPVSRSRYGQLKLSLARYMGGRM